MSYVYEPFLFSVNVGKLKISTKTWQTYKALHDLLPAYLAQYCQLVSVTGRRQLRSSDIDTCPAQQTNTRLGDRSFAAAGPRVVCQPSCASRTLHSDNFDEPSKRIYLVTWQLQRRVTVFFVRCVQIVLLTYLLTYLQCRQWAGFAHWFPEPEIGANI